MTAAEVLGRERSRQLWARSRFGNRTLHKTRGVPQASRPGGRTQPHSRGVHDRDSGDSPVVIEALAAVNTVSFTVGISPRDHHDH